MTPTQQDEAERLRALAANRQMPDSAEIKTLTLGELRAALAIERQAAEAAPSPDPNDALLLAAEEVGNAWHWGDDDEVLWNTEELPERLVALRKALNEYEDAAAPSLLQERDRLRQALERITVNAEHIFDEKPVRDWGETLAEAHAALAATRTATKEPTDD